MTLLNIVALLVPAFAAGMYFNDLVTAFIKGITPDKDDILWFSLNMTFVITNSIICFIK